MTSVDDASTTRTGTRPTTSAAAVRLDQATKKFGDVEAVKALDLTVGRGELLTLLGPSGSGKSTVLGMIAGLVTPTSGRVWLGEEEVHTRPTYQRNLGMVFQSLALFPHMDVYSNIAFPLRMRRRGRAQIKTAVREALDIVRLPDIQTRQIHGLSGGQQQRVAIARALVYQPDLLLLDEPFGALDRRLREEMQLEIVRLHRELDVTIINVTHDQREALMLSDRIAVLSLGHLEQLASSEDVYRCPATEFVAQFLGDANLIRGRIGAAGRAEPMMQTEHGVSLRVPDTTAPDTDCTLVIKSEALEVAAADHDSRSDGAEVLAGIVALRVYEGGAVYYEVDVPTLDMRFKASQSSTAVREMFPVGSAVCLRWDPADTALVVRSLETART